MQNRISHTLRIDENRLAKNWAASDTLRAQLAGQGWLVKDGKDGYTLEPAQS